MNTVFFAHFARNQMAGAYLGQNSFIWGSDHLGRFVSGETNTGKRGWSVACKCHAQERVSFQKSKNIVGIPRLIRERAEKSPRRATLTGKSNYGFSG